MSTATIKSVCLGEKVEDIEELRNSHGSAPVIWDDLWPLYKRADMPAHQRSVLLMTYEPDWSLYWNAYVKASKWKTFNYSELDNEIIIATAMPARVEGAGMKRKPTGFVAKCQCGVIVGAMDYDRTDRKDAGQILGKWLHDGCTVEPQFAGTWSVTVKACRCELAAYPG
ncbi:hypothetical protein [Chrysiogenes arsenatis]|uniref:hypothetical protein n=1 Tax=Chrysiogenes arsenatis TaxID=309797 RepID=UPI0003FE221C|nr:hypothetical protein [Chrysiogenes arsenatis]